MSVPITLLTGFLGAGKTTLLNALLRAPSLASSLVFINEFADLAIDGDLVERIDGNQIETTTGCLCCSFAGDLNRAIYGMIEQHANRTKERFDRIIIESTGLLDPAPVINGLLTHASNESGLRSFNGDFSLSRVVAVFDALNGMETLEGFPEAAKQIALADVAVLTKTDMLGEPGSHETKLHIVERIRGINPGAEIVDRHAEWPRLLRLVCTPHVYELPVGGDDAARWLRANDVQAGSGHSHAAAEAHRHADVRSYCIALDEPVSPEQFDLFLEVLKLYAGTRLMRVKGLFKIADAPDRPVVVHGVQHLISAVNRLDRWPTSDRRTRLVLIGREMDTGKLEAVLRGSWARRTRPAERLARARKCPAA